MIKKMCDDSHDTVIFIIKVGSVTQIRATGSTFIVNAKLHPHIPTTHQHRTLQPQRTNTGKEVAHTSAVVNVERIQHKQ